MSVVSFALRRPITVLFALLAVIAGAILAVLETPRDILPTLNLPVVYVAQPYTGIDPAQMEGFVTYYYEYHFLYINGIESVESKSIQGVSLLKLQFHNGTDMSQAMAETISYVNRARAFMPSGTLPPFVMRFDSGSVPVGDLVFSSDTRSVPEMQDAALNNVRPLFATLPGVNAPPPFGGSARTIVVKANPDRLRAYSMSPEELAQAIAKANALLPSGNIRIGSSMPIVSTNAEVTNIKDLEQVPIRAGGAKSVFVRDVATVDDASDIPTGIALVNGRPAVYIPVTKRSDASTMSVVDLVRQNLPRFQAAVPSGIKVSYEFDQTPYVTHAISGLVTEGLLGALLTGLAVLLFLRDLRSSLIVVINIPLSLLGALIALRLCGQTINIMTLGGLALAVGILVDEATVTIENIHVHLGRGQKPARASFDATNETLVPRLLAALSVAAVISPAFFMVGAVRSLFVPLALAVVFSMACSFVLSGTLVPMLSIWFLRSVHTAEAPWFERLLARYRNQLNPGKGSRALLPIAYFLVCAVVLSIPALRPGREIFPRADVGQLQVRLKAKAGTRIEQTSDLALRALALINEQSNKGVLSSIGFVGVQPASYPVNVIHLWTGGPEEAVLQVQLKPGSPPVAKVEERLRGLVVNEFPDVRFSFEPADILDRILSFGSPTPVVVDVTGQDLKADAGYADRLRANLAADPTLRDVQQTQSLEYPSIKIAVDRQLAGMLGVTANDVARSAVDATTSSRFISPSYWADPKSGVAYQVQVQIPIDQMNSLDQIQNLPVATGDKAPVLMRNIAKLESGNVVGEYDRINGQRQLSITANLGMTDLGKASEHVDAAIAKTGALPPKVNVAVRGQIVPMNQMLTSLGIGFLGAVVVVFIMLAASFQSTRLALVPLFVVPAVAVGVLVSLKLTETSLNIESLVGAIMAVGVGVANAILVTTFAQRHQIAGNTAGKAASFAAASRFRPILMTSSAMVAGMIPMALGLGESGQQTAPLGRAVIGGLIFATLTTLFVLPQFYELLMARASQKSVSIDPSDPESELYDVE